MSLTEIIFLAFALGIDCLIVSFTQGLILTNKRMLNSLLLAFTMGMFQGIMPLLSYYPTGLVSDYLDKYSSFIVFIIFLILGLKFILESLREEEEHIPKCKIGFRCLILMGIATSIDALGAGIGLKLADTGIGISVILIGLISFILSLLGFWSGNEIKKIPTKYLEISGGLILIVLAIKALFY